MNSDFSGSERIWREELSRMTIPISVKNDVLLSKTLQGLIKDGRVSCDLGEELHNKAPLPGLTALAMMIKRSRFGDSIFFNENLHVNTTNVCTLACRFCAFRKGPRHSDAYSLTPEEFVSRIEPFEGKIDEVHAVGGLHPDWNIDHYSDIYRITKNRFPGISIKSLTAVEVKHIASRSGLGVLETLTILRDSGLDSLPGGGAEILVDTVRDRICMGKEKSAEYLEIHGIAHELGIPTNCTMLFGTIETNQDRITHLNKLREQQDTSGGFQCFVPYPFLEDNTRLPEARLASGAEVIRIISLSRIMLDNIPHIKAYRMNIGDHLATIAINSGAD
ncbi:MAG: CofH family radical SAM protein, partial [Candidatus Thermoplasmatota archaeon]|nr:CofH family radical SAM protein [Candidatus Thermoplasmatota archaeon]